MLSRSSDSAVYIRILHSMNLYSIQLHDIYIIITAAGSEYIC